MVDKTSTEVQEIFGLERDDLRRLEKAGVLNPVKSGQGKVSRFGQEDMDRLLDVKIYLLAGYRIVDMGQAFTEGYDSEEMVAEQIHIYKKRIQLLEYIRVARADIKKLGSLSQKQMIETAEASAESTNLPQVGSAEYFDKFWDLIKLVFIVDYLSQKESFADDSDVVLKRAFTAYHIIESILKMSGIEINQEELVNVFFEMASTPIEDGEIRMFAKELVQEYLHNKDQLMKEFLDECVNPITEKLDEQAGEVFRNMVGHFFQFILDYFVDEEELYCVFVNFIRFVNGLDQEALSKGIVRLGGKR